MNFLRRLATGQIALWRVFWMIGTPLTLTWLITGAAMLFGFGIRDVFGVALIIAVFTLATLAIPFISLAIWRSASNYAGKTAWHKALAWGARAGAVFWALVAVLSIPGLAYLGYDFILAVLAPD